MTEEPRCPKCGRPAQGGWRMDWGTGVSNGITCECGAVLEVAAYAVADYDVEFEVREKPGRMDPVEQRRSQ